MEIPIIEAQLRGYRFQVDQNDAIRGFYDESRLLKNGNNPEERRVPPPTMEQICDYLAPHAHFQKISYNDRDKKVRFYIWRRQEGGVWVYEGVEMNIENSTGICVSFANRVISRKLDLEVPADFKIEEWQAKTMDYVKANWKRMISAQLKELEERKLSYRDFYPKSIVDNRWTYFYSPDKRIVCRFRFSIEPRKPGADPVYGLSPIEIDVDVKHKVIITEEQ